MSFQRCKSIHHLSRFLHYKVRPKNVGVSLVKNHERDEEECNYPSIKKFDVHTKDRIHSFSASSEDVFRFIQLGAINKHIAIQYCHYLAELCRVSDTPEDTAYYSTKCLDLMQYLLRNHKDMPTVGRDRLISDCADTTRQNCSVIASTVQLNNTARVKDLSQYLGACYKFGLWEQADRVIGEVPKRLVTFRVADPFTEGVINASKEYKNLSNSTEDRAALRARVINSLAKICRHFTISRAQMISKRKSEFIQALQELDFKVKINPVIKMTGRCTACMTSLPLLDQRVIKTINESIRSQMNEGAEDGIYLNTSPNDVRRFGKFLRELYEEDKRPIDCVIDALNIAYRASSGFSVYQAQQLTEDLSRTYKKPDHAHQTQVLINSIIRGEMLSRFKKILVVGKFHMTNWPGLMDFFKKHNIHFYASYNNTKDDLFQLLAATLNPSTILVTNDFLRDHLAQLGEEERILLERWIDTHQAWVIQRNLKPIWPTPYEKLPCVDSSSSIFHLPVIDFHQLEKVGISEPPPHLSSKILTWVCCDTR